MKKNVIKEKSFAFAVRIVNASKFLTTEKKEFVMSKQLLRSGTAVGALYREAEQAESKADFIHKMAIAQKECNETLYWLELLSATDFLEKEAFESLHINATELMKLITSIIKSTKLRINN
ncbi:four helix bundle protein [Algibacter pacificus]|uniref:four helix bundle protein n=1 Tax=Algibacter pacificus TaxID=2599389 RepID=UPI0011C7BDF0|nr:four helix bundle protein [Algibacter pacificus]